MKINRLQLFLLLCALFLSSSVLAHEPSPGLWFSPEHNGHGFDLQKTGDQYIVVFYSYTDQSEPVWYLSVASESHGRVSGVFNLYEYLPDRSPPQQVHSSSTSTGCSRQGGRGAMSNSIHPSWHEKWMRKQPGNGFKRHQQLHENCRENLHEKHWLCIDKFIRVRA